MRHAVRDRGGGGDRPTDDAEYVALTRLQADALVTTDVAVGAAVEHLVELAALTDLVLPAG